VATKDTKPAAQPAPSTEVAAPSRTAVTMPMSWKDRMKAVAVKTAEAEAPQGGFISFKSGRMSIGDTLVPGDKIECIIVDYLFHNKYYNVPYNAKNPVPPVCYAFSREELDLEPAEGAEEPQAESCAECPQNVWGSAGNGSKGKACTNSRRLWLLAADALNDPSKISKLDFFQCDLPVTSIKNFSRFVGELPPGMPPFAFVVEMSVKPHETSLFQVHFKPMEEIKNEAALEQLAARNWKNEQEPLPKYPTKEEMAERASGGTGSTKY